MRSVAVLFVITLAACSPDAEVTGSTNKCATDLYPSTIQNCLISAWMSASSVIMGTRPLARHRAL